MRILERKREHVSLVLRQKIVSFTMICGLQKNIYLNNNIWTIINTIFTYYDSYCLNGIDRWRYFTQLATIITYWHVSCLFSGVPLNREIANHSPHLPPTWPTDKGYGPYIGRVLFSIYFFIFPTYFFIFPSYFFVIPSYFFIFLHNSSYFFIFPEAFGHGKILNSPLIYGLWN